MRWWFAGVGGRSVDGWMMGLIRTHIWLAYTLTHLLAVSCSRITIPGRGSNYTGGQEVM